MLTNGLAKAHLYSFCRAGNTNWLCALKNAHNYDRIIIDPIFIIKNGYGDLVVMSIETYEQIAEIQLIDNAIAEAEEEYEKTGILLDAKETLGEPRNEIFMRDETDYCKIWL